MEFEHQKPVSDAYRRGWEAMVEASMTKDELREYCWKAFEANAMPILDRLSAQLHERALASTYPNGCPILDEK
jgi:hypothetical protein